MVKNFEKLFTEYASKFNLKLNSIFRMDDEVVSYLYEDDLGIIAEFEPKTKKFSFSYDLGVCRISSKVFRTFKRKSFFEKNYLDFRNTILEFKGV